MGRRLLLEPFSTLVRLRRLGRALPSGVHPFGPLFFALGFDELMEMLRSRMANLPVEVKFIPDAEVVRDESGAVYLPLPTDKFGL